MRPPRARLLAKLLVATLLPTAAVLATFGAVAHEVARRALEDELGARLATAAAGAAMLVLPEQVQALGPGDEGSQTYDNVSRKLRLAREQLGVRRVALVARDLTGRGDTGGRIALGARAHEFASDAPEIEQAARGRPASSPLFWAADGQPYKRGYARVGPDAAGFVVVEGSAGYFASLQAFRRWLLVAGAVGLAVVVGLAVLLAHRITGPLRRLAGAAERIGRGDLQAVVPVETTDEIGSLAARLDEMREALRARDERLQLMLAGIAHEVRNPLGGLELFAGLLRDGLGGQPDRLAEVARIEREIGHLKSVVTEFLDYARRAPPQPAPFPVLPLLEEVREVCGSDRLRLEAPAALEARADRGQIRRALINLARNAIAASGEGPVVLAARPAGGEVEWEVRDGGPGVPDELRGQIFTPFFTTREKGTGLGLALVRDIVRDHGGEMSVDRAPEGGACFRFSTGR